MKIDDTIKKIASTSASDVKQKQTSGAKTANAGSQAGSASASGSSNAGSAVNVSLSKQLQNVTNQVGEAGTFDVKKVEEIKAAIANGQFQIDTEKVADGLIKTVQELIQKPGK